MKKTLVKNIGRLQTPVGSYSHKGEEQGINRMMENAEILVEDGIIAAISPPEPILKKGWTRWWMQKAVW